MTSREQLARPTCHPGQKHASCGQFSKHGENRMRNLAPLSALVAAAGLATLAATVPAFAQDKPTTVACPAEVASMATCYSARHESGAYLLAAIPKDWNG